MTHKTNVPVTSPETAGHTPTSLCIRGFLNPDLGFLCLFEWKPRKPPYSLKHQDVLPPLKLNPEIKPQEDHWKSSEHEGIYLVNLKRQNQEDRKHQGMKDQRTHSARSMTGDSKKGDGRKKCHKEVWQQSHFSGVDKTVVFQKGPFFSQWTSRWSMMYYDYDLVCQGNKAT